MKRAVVSVGGSIVILALAFGIILTTGYLSLERGVFVPDVIPWACGWIISWPLIVFPGIFLNSPRAPSPESPTEEAFVAMLIFDAALYAALIYGVLSLFARLGRSWR